MDIDVQHHTRTLAQRSPDHLRVGPFTVQYNPRWDSPFANYAIPDDDAAPTPSDVRALIEAFRARARVPRLEYVPDCAPAVEHALLAAGFGVEDRPSLMACTTAALIEPAPIAGVEFEQPRTRAGLFDLAAVQHEAYSEPGEPNDGSIGWLRGCYQNGGIVVLARVEGQPVGAAACTAPVDGLTELVGVSVRDLWRRRGIGAAVSAYATATAHGRGYSTVWLEPADTTVERMYAGIGFHRIGEKLNISLKHS